MPKFRLVMRKLDNHRHRWTGVLISVELKVMPATDPGLENTFDEQRAARVVWMDR